MGGSSGKGGGNGSGRGRGKGGSAGEARGSGDGDAAQVGGAGSGGGGGAGGGGSGGDCPPSVRSRLPLPAAPVLHQGEAVAARLGGTSPETVLVVHSSSGIDIGALAGLPELAQLIRCIRDGATYAGSIDALANGAFEIVLWRS